MPILWLLAPWLAVSVAAGDHFTCALTRTGGVKCWGGNSTAELGDGTTGDRRTPVDVVELRGVSQIAAGTHACAVVAGGGLRCWGGDFWVGHHTRPRAVSTYGTVSRLAVGSDYTCAIAPNRTARCGGRGEDGKIIQGMTAPGSTEEPAPVPGLDRVRQIAAGAFHACALGEDARVRCWGSNSWSHIALGDEKSIPKARLVEKFDLVNELAAGATHTCGLRRGEVFCWGDNLVGQLGDGSEERHAEPRQVKGLPPIVAVSAGDFTSCALGRDGSAWCWGDNQFGTVGSLGDNARKPRRVDGISDAKAVSCGGKHCCVITGSGRLKCWGSNQFGQLGVGKPLDESTRPLDVVQSY